MSDLYINETRIIESNTRCDLNTDYAQKIINQQVTLHCKDLDFLIQDIKEIVFSDTDDLTTPELESCCIKLSLTLYDFESEVEYSSLRADIAKMLEDDKFSGAMLEQGLSDKRVTVAQKQAVAKSESSPETVTSIITNNIYKLMMGKRSSAYELLNTLKKLITSRIANMNNNP